MKQFKSRHSMGKYLRKLKNLRKNDNTLVSKDIPQNLQEYIQHLRIKGLLINKVKYGTFKTKNNLLYSGLYATEKILANEVIIQVPQELLLTTKKAYFSSIQHIFDENPQFFSAEFSENWEDRILAVYLLYENQRGKQSEWYHLIQNLSRDIDYLIFWKKEEIELLQDETISISAQKLYKEFTLEYEATEFVLSKYPKIFQEETFSYENFKWVYTHLTTRCFGRYLCYVTMVPFCELLNHECCDVYYDFLYNKKENKPTNYETPDMSPREIEDEDNSDTSQGTYNSQDEESESEYNYDVNKDDKVQFTLEELLNVEKEIDDWILSNLNYGDFFSVFVIQQLFIEIRKIQKKITDQVLFYYQAREAIRKIQKFLVIYKSDLVISYRNIFQKQYYGKPFAQKIKKVKGQIFINSQYYCNDEQTVEQIFNKKLEKEKQYFSKEWEEDKFDNFIMKCSKKDQFEKEAQVYFCYGRLSNRKLLLRYGLTLEHNKYDHVYIRINYQEHLKQEMVYRLQVKSIYSLFAIELQNFKIQKIQIEIYPILCRTCFFLQISLLVLFQPSIISREYDSNNIQDLLSVCDLELELKGIQLAKFFLIDFIKDNFKESIQENKEMLYDESKGYHEHFAIIYRLERQRIAELQLKLIQICERIFIRILQEQVKIEEAILIIDDLETEEEFDRHRKLLEQYLKQVKK